MSSLTSPKPATRRSSEKESSDAPPLIEKREAAGVGSSVMRMLRGSPQASSSSTATAPQQEAISPEAPITLDRSSGTTLGLTFDGDTFVIASVDSEGLAASWNAANPGRELRVGHRILQVNGRTDAAGIGELLQSRDLLEVKILREVVCLDSEDRVNSSSPCGSSDQNNNFKAWVADVASEETPPPDGANKANSKSDDDTDCVKNKDGDLVELPSPSTQTTLLSNSLVSPQGTISTPANLGRLHGSNGSKEDGRSDSRTQLLGAGDLASLREMAVEAATSNTDGTHQASSSWSGAVEGTTTVPSMWSVSSAGSPPVVPETAPPAPSLFANLDTAMQARSRSQAPDDEGHGDIAPVHSSLATTSPSLHQSLRQDRATPGSEALFSGSAVSSLAKTSNMLKEQLQMHGQGNAHNDVRLLGSGPFWTCGTTPNLRQHRCAATSGRTTLGGILRGSNASVAAATSRPFDLLSIFGGCSGFLSTAIDMSDEPEPPDDELTTVLLETKEQRLQWRDFLSEAVSKCRANALFASYDVDADPPRYARPPMSAAPVSSEKVEMMVRSYRQAGRSPPHVVAPCGAGFSELSASCQGESTSSGLSRPNEKQQQEQPPVLVTASAIGFTSSSTSSRAILTDLDSGVGLTPSFIESGLGPGVSPHRGADSSLTSTTHSHSKSQAPTEHRPPPAG
mmetsp:Transcript_107831/g.168434  ORF Transcript_107831/g.168434 Transcript_107831/m.168434 type:complete len:681 (-) Transcript_107831:94-2136(-)